MKKYYTLLNNGGHVRSSSTEPMSTQKSTAEILALTHFQIGELRNGAFITRSPVAKTEQAEIKLLHKLKTKSLGVRVIHMPNVLPVLNQNVPNFIRRKTNSQKETENNSITNITEATEIKAGRNSSERLILSEFDFSQNYTNNHSSINQLPSLTSPKYENEITLSNYSVQRESVNRNKYFSKYNRSIAALDKLDASKVSLPREAYYYPEQKEINQVLEQEVLSAMKEVDTSAKIVQDNVPETIEIMKEKSYQFKVDALDQEFPMTVDIETKYGVFEIFISKSHARPDLGTCDYYTRNEHFEVHYSSSEDVRYVYFRIYAIERAKFNIKICFQPKIKLKKRSLSTIALKKPERKINELKKKKIYEFYHEDMTQEEFNEFKSMIDEIKREKRIKLLKLANNQNLIQENIRIVPDYGKLKQLKLFHMVQKQTILAHVNKLNREQVDADTKRRKLYASMKYVLKNLEVEWNNSQEMQRLERISFQRKWVVALSVIPILNKLSETMLVIKNSLSFFNYKKLKWLRVSRRVQERSATKIQRAMRRYLAKPLLIKYKDENFVTKYKKDINLQTKLMTKLFEAVNAIAVISRKRNIIKAKRVIRIVFKDMCSLIPITEAMDEYIEKITRIQERWRQEMEVFWACIEAFKLYWKQYCNGLIQEEARKLKKDKTEVISKISEDLILKYAKEFVRTKLSSFKIYKALYNQDQERKSKLVQNGISEQESEISKEESSTFLTDTLNANFSNPYRPDQPKKKIQRMQFSISEVSEKDQSKAKPSLRIKPTKQELKQIWNEILQEI